MAEYVKGQSVRVIKNNSNRLFHYLKIPSIAIVHKQYENGDVVLKGIDRDDGTTTSQTVTPECIEAISNYSDIKDKLLSR